MEFRRVAGLEPNRVTVPLRQPCGHSAFERTIDNGYTDVLDKSDQGAQVVDR